MKSFQPISPTVISGSDSKDNFCVSVSCWVICNEIGIISSIMWVSPKVNERSWKLGEGKIYLSVHFSSVPQLCLTLCDPMDSACQASLSFTISQILLKLMPTELVMASNHLILCHSLFLLNSIFPRVKLFTSSGQSIRASALASVLPMNIQDWFPLELTDLISLLSKGLTRVFSSTTV